MKALSIEDHRKETRESEGEPVAELVTIPFGDDPTWTMQIDSHLTIDCKDRLMTFLRANEYVFASSALDMLGILFDIIIHKLNVNSDYRLV